MVHGNIETTRNSGLMQRCGDALGKGWGGWSVQPMADGRVSQDS